MDKFYIIDDSLNAGIVYLRKPTKEDFEWFLEESEEYFKNCDNPADGYKHNYSYIKSHDIQELLNKEVVPMARLNNIGLATYYGNFILSNDLKLCRLED